MGIEFEVLREDLPFGSRVLGATVENLASEQPARASWRNSRRAAC